MLNSQLDAPTTQAELQDGASQAEDPNGSVGEQQVIGMLAIGSVETQQVLALSSNGVNKTWYATRNILEESLSESIQALNSVICEDAHDTAVWRERMNLLKQKEFDRKRKYVVIMAQLNDQKMRLRFFESWRRLVLKHFLQRDRQVAASDLCTLSKYRLLRRNFSKWGNWHDRQLRRQRRAHLVNALMAANDRTQVLCFFQRWQILAVQRRLRRFLLECLELIAQASAQRLLSVYYCKLRAFGQLRGARKGASPGALPPPLSSAQLERLAAKAQQQTLHRALHKWIGFTQRQQEMATRRTALDRYAEVFLRAGRARVGRVVFHGWRRWCLRRRRLHPLRALAVLLESRRGLHLREVFYLRWMEWLHRSRLRQGVEATKEVEARLVELERTHGGDLFEKLRLQGRINELIDRQAQVEMNLARDRERLDVLKATSERICRRLGESEGDPASVGSPPSEDFNHGNETALMPFSGDGGGGPIAANARFYRRLIDQQRLSPGVLAQMPAADAIHHVFAQLKGGVLNLYTDLALFRQVKDRRRGGIAAAAIFLEAFAEVKRAVLAVLKTPTTASAASSVASFANGGRWGLRLEALDRLPAHHCAGVLSAIKTMVVAYDLLSPSDAERISSTCEEVVQNADWIFLFARACYLRRKPALPVNNRV
ncbi:unnamed protein product [Phytomonas sp. EM1]|nr:unnamed protein product [Phytomonas sp. EM1]|eukprot:CCW61071.1 unnamed protein product [Phytomonas sp. isolate EM1]